jgi:hypothetical protein
MKLIQPPNKKLHNTYMFNLPATKEVCGRTCKGCYAIGEQKRYPNVLPARESRYEASLQLDFTSTIHNELANLRKRPKYFRIHASGEFYDQAYVNKWLSIIKRNPDIIFYAYTKRMKEFNFNEFMAQPNAVLINSFHYGGLNYGKLDKAPSGAFICPEHTKQVKCGESCTYCMSKPAQANGVWFKQH